jgi:hypothetical protein
LLPQGFSPSDISDVRIEIYRVFPLDSSTTRTIRVPTRANSPSDVEFTDRDSNGGGLAYGLDLLNGSFTAANSVLNGINPIPHQQTGGEGPVTGAEVRFDVTFEDPLDLPAGHYFFVPQVQLRTAGNFFWLSTPPHQFTGDLQEWIRNQRLQPDWLRVGTDIVGGTPAPTFDAAFSLSGNIVTPNFTFSIANPAETIPPAEPPATVFNPPSSSQGTYLPPTTVTVFPLPVSYLAEVTRVAAKPFWVSPPVPAQPFPGLIVWGQWLDLPPVEEG